MKRKSILNFRDNPSTIVRRKRGELTLTFNKIKLGELYYEKNKSLEDIAKEYGCSRQHIMKSMRIFIVNGHQKWLGCWDFSSQMVPFNLFPFLYGQWI